MSELVEELRLAACETDRPVRLLRLAAVIGQALAPLGLKPVLVGGAVVEIYTEGAYQTGDLDFVTPDLPGITGAMASLGFSKEGRNYHHVELDLWVEFSGSELQPGEETRLIDTVSGTARIVSPEDILLDRVRAFIYWRSLLDGENALLLLHTCQSLDWAAVEARLRAEPGLASCLHGLESLAREWRSGKTRGTGELEARLRELQEAE